MLRAILKAIGFLVVKFSATRLLFILGLLINFTLIRLILLMINFSLLAFCLLLLAFI